MPLFAPACGASAAFFGAINGGISGFAADALSAQSAGAYASFRLGYTRSPRASAELWRP